MALSRSIHQALEECASRTPNGAVVFDADGTLWSNDVGHIVFNAGIAQSVFRDECLEELQAFGEQWELDAGKGASASAWVECINDAWLDGRVPEKDATEMQVWCWGGWSEKELLDFSLSALKAAEHDKALQEGVVDFARRARELHLSTFVVSASPQVVAYAGTRFVEDGDLFAKEHVAGGTLKILPSGIQGPWFSEPLPWGPEKVSAGRRLFGKRPWLAALGDSAFDVAMMEEAEFSVSIGQRQSLIEQLEVSGERLKRHFRASEADALRI